MVQSRDGFFTLIVVVTLLVAVVALWYNFVYVPEQERQGRKQERIKQLEDNGLTHEKAVAFDNKYNRLAINNIYNQTALNFARVFSMDENLANHGFQIYGNIRDSNCELDWEKSNFGASCLG